jgi:hypothetical protein
MSIVKTYFDIITSESVVNISTRDICDHNHAKIKVDCLFNIILIDIGDKIVVNHSGDTFSYIFTSIWANQSLDLLIKFLNNVLGAEKIFSQLMNKVKWLKFTINSKLLNVVKELNIY